MTGSKEARSKDVDPLIDDRGQDGGQRAFIRPARLGFFARERDPPMVIDLAKLLAYLEAGKVLQSNGAKRKHCDHQAIAMQAGDLQFRPGGGSCGAFHQFQSKLEEPGGRDDARCLAAWRDLIFQFGHHFLQPRSVDPRCKKPSHAFDSAEIVVASDRTDARLQFCEKGAHDRWRNMACSNCFRIESVGTQAKVEQIAIGPHIGRPRDRLDVARAASSAKTQRGLARVQPSPAIGGRPIVDRQCAICGAHDPSASTTLQIA